MALDDLLRTGSAQVHIMEDGCLETLEKHLDKNTYHVIHISCHGGIKENRNVLYLEEKKSWKARPVTGDELAGVIRTSGRKKSPVFF